MGVSVEGVEAKGICLRIADLTLAQYKALRAWTDDSGDSEAIASFYQDSYVRHTEGAGADERMGWNSLLPPRASVLIAANRQDTVQPLFSRRVTGGGAYGGPDGPVFAEQAEPLNSADDAPLLALLARAPPTVRELLLQAERDGAYGSWIFVYFA